MSQAGRVVAAIGTETVPIAADEVISGLATRQHGVVGRGQLLVAGIGSRAIRHRVRAGRLHPLYRGVYAVGHRVLSQKGRWMAAVLASGDGAVLSHRSAAALWGIRPSTGRIEVTTPRSRASRPGLLLHRAVLRPDEVTTHDGIPTTTPDRTQLDLAGVLNRHQLDRALSEAEILRLPGPKTLVDRYPTKKGTAHLRTLLVTARRSTPTRSELEAKFLAFLDDHHLPRPQTNILIEGFEVDCAWPEHRVIVELDGYAFHATRAAFERDRRRDRRLAAAGWTVLRVTWRDLDEPDRLAAELAPFF